MNKRNRNSVILLAAALLLIALGGWTLTRRGGAEEVTYRTAEAERQDLRQTVSATGIVQPLTVVDIKSRAGGEVKVLAVDVGTVVKPGDLIARIDPTDSQTTYNQAEADVSAAQARVTQAPIRWRCSASRWRPRSPRRRPRSGPPGRATTRRKNRRRRSRR